MASLTSLQDFLDRQGYTTHRVPATASLECLLVSLGYDEAGREVFLQVRHDFQTILENAPQKKGVHLWDFLVTLPFHAKSTSFASVARLLSHLNKISSLIHFFLSEKDRAVFLHHMLVTDGEEISDTLAATSLAAIIQAIDLFSLPIEEIAQEKRSLEDLLEAAEREHVAYE